MTCCRSATDKPPEAARKGLLTETFNSRADDMIKVICVGESGIGKTFLVRRLAGQEIDTNSLTTIGVETFHFKINIGEDTTQVGKDGQLTVQLWDTAGSERFHSITRQFFRGAHLAFLCFQLGDELSFNRMEMWIRMLKENSLHRSEADALKICLVGTKADLLTSETLIKVSRPNEDARFAHLSYFETSAIENTGIEQLRRVFYTTGVKQRDLRLAREKQNSADTLRLTSKEIPTVPLTYQMQKN
jgi:small GTP-binding protein